MEKKQSTFDKLSAINVNDKVAKKNGSTYLSWAWAWSEVKKICPDASYHMGETEYDEHLGFMCHSTVTIDGESLSMWLPVMDGANKSMKKAQYTYTTRYGEKSVEAATTFDINKTLMRCLVKNLAMFGFAIYIYAGEDLPESETSQATITTAKAAAAPPADNKVALIEGVGDWDKVVKYVTENKSMGIDKLSKSLSVWYKIDAKTKTSLTKIVNKK